MNPRTCLVTGEKKSAENLIRFTIQSGILTFDKAKKNPGRGGYVSRDSAIIKKLPKIRGKIVHFMKVKQFEIPTAEELIVCYEK